MNMTKVAEKVSTGQVTFAARDSEYDGHKIKEGDILAIENGKVTSVESDIVKAAVKITKNMVKKRKGEASFITVIYGEDAPPKSRPLWWSWRSRKRSTRISR